MGTPFKLDDLLGPQTPQTPQTPAPAPLSMDAVLPSSTIEDQPTLSPAEERRARLQAYDPALYGQLSEAAKGIAQGLFVDLPLGVAHFLMTPLRAVGAAETPEEARNPLLQAMKLARGSTPEQIQHDIHASILARVGGAQSPAEVSLDALSGFVTQGFGAERAALPGPTPGNYIYDYLSGAHTTEDVLASNVNVPEQGVEERARAITGVGLLGLYAIGAKEPARTFGPPPIKFDVVSRSIDASRVMANRAISDAIASGLERVPEPTQALPGIQRLSSVEQQVAIRTRLLDQEAGDVSAALLRAHNELKPFGTTVIPSVENLGEAVRRAKQVNPDIGLATYERADGAHDVAVYGSDSPLTNEELRSQFSAQGFFEGQEAFYRGSPVVFKDRIQLAGGEDYALIKPVGLEEAEYVPFNELRRPSYTEVGEPLVLEVRKNPLSVQEAIDYLGASKTTLQGAAEEILLGKQRLGELVQLAVGSEPAVGVIGQAEGAFGLQHGINVLPISAERLSASPTAGLPLETTTFREPTAFVFADAKGNPVAAMMVDHAYDPTAPGTYKQVLAGVEPVQMKSSSSVLDFVYDASAPDFTLGRAALALAEEAKRIGVSQVFAEVDPASARIFARVLNKYVKRVETTHARARVGEATIDVGSLTRDFQGYLDNAMNSAKTAARLSGINLSKTKVVDARGEPIRVYHGTTTVFDDFSLESADPNALAGLGIYFTTDARVAGGGPGLAGGYAEGEVVRANYFVVPEEAHTHARSQREAGFGVVEHKQRITIAGEERIIYVVESHTPSNVRPAYLDIRNPFDWDKPADPRFVNYVKSRFIELSKPLLDSPRASSETATIFQSDVSRFDDFLRGNPAATNANLHSLAQELFAGIIPGKDFDVNSLLREGGYDGIRYAGGRNIPMLDERGQPIEHDAWVAFDPKQVVSPWVSGALDFDHIVSAFARERGFLPEEARGLKNFLEQQIAKKERELYLTPDERALYNRAVEKLRKELGGEPSPLRALAEQKELPLSVAASTNNVTAEWTPHGVIEVRARDAGNTLLGVFKTDQAAKSFINQLGQDTNAPNLTDLGDVSRGIGGGAVPPPPQGPADVASGLPPNLPPDPLNVDWLPPGDRIIPTIADYVASSFPLLVEYDRVINGYDARWNTRFSEGSRALQGALRQMDNARHPWLVRLHKEVDALLRGKTRDRSAVLARYAETMGSEQIAQEGFFRPLNNAELNIGNWLASHGIDNAKVLNYTRQMIELEERFADQPTRLKRELATLADEFKLDKDHLTAAGVFRSVRDLPIEQAYLGHIVRYADAKLLESQGFDLTPEGFAKTHALTSKELLAMRNLERISSELADVFEIPEYRKIRRWISHFVAQNERGVSPQTAFLGQRGLNGVGEIRFLGDLARTGELSNYVMDPVLALLRYTNAGFRAKYLNPVLKTVLTSWKSELDAVPAPAQRGAARTLSKMLDDVRGIPDASDSFVRRTVEEILNAHGIQPSSDVAKAAVNAINATWSLKFLAFRVFQGIRDYTTSWTVAHGRFGLERAVRMHARGFGATPEQIAMLEATGAIPPAMTPISVESPAALISTHTVAARAAGFAARAGAKYADYVNTVADWGLRGSMQPQVYARWHAGAYLEGRELAGRTFTKMVSGEITARQAFKDLTLDAYAPPFIRQLQDLVRAGKFEDAAHLYGQETSRMTVVTYGAAAHPRGWNTVYGRLLTNYGRFPTWATMVMTEVASRGSRAYRVRALARFSANQTLMWGALASAGIAGWNWMLLPSVRWLGGPLVSMLQSSQKVMSASNRSREEGVNEILHTLDPTPLVVHDIFDGLRITNSEDANSPTNPFESVIRMAGPRLRAEPSLFDYLIGEY